MRFALITEGASEGRIIKHIIEKYFKDKDPVVTSIQPKILSDKQTTDGGWDEVLKYCQDEELIITALKENDFLVIQIDTDMSQNSPFDIPHTKIDSLTGQNIKKPLDELYEDVLEKIQNLIPESILEAHHGRIFFAICSDTIECWLLPIYYTNKHKADTSTCIGTLNVELGKKKINKLPTASSNKNSPKAINTYKKILGNWKRRKEIEEAAEHHHGFGKFLESLRALD